MEKIKIIVTAPMGKLGKLIAIQALEREEIEVLGALGRKGADYIGQDLGIALGLGKKVGALIHDDLEEIIGEAQILVDFSKVEVSMQVLEACVKHGKGLVCGTTGFCKEEMEDFHKAAETIPLLYAANTSRPVNLMNKILQLLAQNLGQEAQIDIVEMHDKLKLDAPSGTSLEMGKLMAQALGLDFDQAVEYGRQGRGIREAGKICYHSIRSGDISSSHKVIFGLEGERLEISHHAHNWNCFARGALDCLVFLSKQKAGFYSTQDVIS